MLIGTALGMLVTWTSPVTICNKFFDGMGHAYGFVFGIIIAAGAFIARPGGGGRDQGSHRGPEERQVASCRSLGTFGPFLLAVLSGSGDAATLAFNNAVTPHAASFGISTINLGNLANIGGALGRSMSPVAAGLHHRVGLRRRQSLRGHEAKRGPHAGGGRDGHALAGPLTAVSGHRPRPRRGCRRRGRAAASACSWNDRAISTKACSARETQRSLWRIR